MLSIREALIYTGVMGGVIFFCRVCPFLFFRGKEGISGNEETPLFTAFLRFVETVVPPVAMTVLAFNALSSPLKEDLRQGIPVFLAAAFTVLVHLWKRNALFSIFGGTFVYMILSRIVIL